MAKTMIGAIRWDAWQDGNLGYAVEKCLGPEKYHYRLPFFAKEISKTKVLVRADSQEVMDKEIAYAKAGAIDYWAFCYYHTLTEMNKSLNFYLKSTRKSDINFCFILQAGHMGPKNEWSKRVDMLIEYFRDPKYQKVLGNRPLLYLFDITKDWKTFFGSDEEVLNAFNILRDKCAAAGLADPYLTGMQWSPDAAWFNLYKLDAISAYSNSGGGAHDQPYLVLAGNNRLFRNGLKDLGVKVIPLVNTGWDNRPRVDNPTPWDSGGSTSYINASPHEIAAHVKETVDWAGANPNIADANAVLIYAWNEIDEGGWLLPSITGDASRLNAIKAILSGPDKK